MHNIPSLSEDSRRQAAFILSAWMNTRKFPTALLPTGPTRGFVQDLVYTTIRRLRPIRHVLRRLVTKKPAVNEEAYLYIGIAQLLYMPDVPDYAAVNETVNAAKLAGDRNFVSFVNGVLRSAQRRRAELEALIADAPPSVRESFPAVLYRRWRARLGDERTLALMRWHNQPATTYLARPDGSFTALEHGKRVSDVAGYGKGEFIVQDPATALAVRLTDPRPGESILDACAAPGGKTIQLAWRGAKVTACEVNAKRSARLLENLKRLNLEVKVITALPQPDDASGERFQKVLVDAPCSNTGVLRRRPDARWNWSEEKLQALVRLQAEILDRAATLLAPGGRLVYSTCSIEPEENQAQVDAFLARHPRFRLAEVCESIPTETDHDGAFAAALDMV